MEVIIIKEDLGEKCCSICRESYKKGDILRYLSCDHSFHKKCIKGWLVNKNSCPICRKDIPIVSEVVDDSTIILQEKWMCEICKELNTCREVFCETCGAVNL